MLLAEFALDARLELIRQAEVSLDVQCYHIANDAIGHALLRELALAARRGVRVRLLLDDLYTTGMDRLLMALDAQPNFELRLFNPFVHGRDSTLLRAMNFLNEFDRLNHRMHNKLLIADGAIAIVGGRNMADEYFLRHAGANFIDFEALVVGPVVAELALAFDPYWASDHAVALQSVANANAADTPERLRDELDAFIRATAPPPAPMPTSRDEYGAPTLTVALDAGLPDLVWAPAQAFADDVQKVGMAKHEGMQQSVTYRVAQLIGQAQSEVVLVSPYFIPGPMGQQVIQQLRQRQVRVSVITNSMGSSDEPMVSLAYEPYRMPLLQIGVELYELSAKRLQRDERVGKLFGESIGRLHAKLGLIDREIVLLGSMNLDPRSAWINTELAVVVRSPELARIVRDTVNINGLKAMYRLKLSPDGKHLQWISNTAEPEILDQDPDFDAWTRLKSMLLSTFVAEDQL